MGPCCSHALLIQGNTHVSFDSMDPIQGQQSWYSVMSKKPCWQSLQQPASIFFIPVSNVDQSTIMFGMHQMMLEDSGMAVVTFEDCLGGEKWRTLGAWLFLFSSVRRKSPRKEKKMSNYGEKSRKGKQRKILPLSLSLLGCFFNDGAGVCGFMAACVCYVQPERRTFNFDLNFPPFHLTRFRKKQQQQELRIYVLILK